MIGIEDIHPETRANMKKPRRIEHMVFNSLLRIEGMTGTPLRPFEKPSDTHAFWILELTGLPEPLTKWQKRVLPIIRRHMNRLRQWRKSGTRIVMHIQTQSPAATFPAIFEPTLLKTLALFDCTLEHGVEIAPEQEGRSRTRCRTERRKARRSLTPLFDSCYSPG